MKKLRDYAKEFIAKHPHLKEQVDDLVQLCFDEIEEAKYRVKLKREIRKKIPRASWFSIRNLPTNVLEKLV